MSKNNPVDERKIRMLRQLVNFSPARTLILLALVCGTLATGVVQRSEGNGWPHCSSVYTRGQGDRRSPLRRRLHTKRRSFPLPGWGDTALHQSGG
jgi:hypothetical protein